MVDLVAVLARLARKRPVFHSEADFQHALAWEIHTLDSGWSIRLEFKPAKSEAPVHIDIWAMKGTVTLGIEVKYKTKKANLSYDGEAFDLLHHSAQDCGSYDFWKDVHRLERVVGAYSGAVGYAVFLTNDDRYWRPRQRANTCDAAFLLHDDRIVSGELAWGPETSRGTMRGRENPIVLRSTYRLSWRDYSHLGQNPAVFRYLLVPVIRATA